MTKEIKLNDIVIIPTNQSGIVYSMVNEVCVLLRNGDFWYGPPYEVRHPTSEEELKSCIVDIDKWKR